MKVLKVAHEKFTWNGREIPCMGRYGGHIGITLVLRELDAQVELILSTGEG